MCDLDQFTSYPLNGYIELAQNCYEKKNAKLFIWGLEHNKYSVNVIYS